MSGSGGGVVVEHSTTDPVFEGLSPATTVQKETLI
jgi:hypothetical protein